MMINDSSRLLIDSNILIDFLRGRLQAVEFIAGLEERITISAITISELYAGVRDGKEREDLDALIATAEIVELSEGIAVQGGLIQREYRKSHGVGLADSVIAATALANGLRLATLNRKHFPMFSDLIVPYSTD